VLEVIDEGQGRQWLSRSHVRSLEDDTRAARVLLNRVLLARARQFGACFLGLFWGSIVGARRDLAIEERW
jgi:hypothetical protein